MPGAADDSNARLARALLPASPWKVALVIVTLSSLVYMPKNNENIRTFPTRFAAPSETREESLTQADVMLRSLPSPTLHELPTFLAADLTGGRVIVAPFAGRGVTGNDDEGDWSPGATSLAMMKKSRGRPCSSRTR